MIQDYSIRDGSLTGLGFQQCKALQDHLQKHLEISQQVELIVVSPMRRTLQTCEASLQWLIERGVPVQPRGEWQETSGCPCDIGTEVDTLAKEFPAFSFDTVFPEWPAKTGRWACAQEAVIQRGIDCRRWLKSRPERVIAVVSHVGFLGAAVSRKRYSNADYRVFDFANDGGDELIEWKLTEERGGGMGRSEKGTFYADEGTFYADV